MLTNRHYLHAPLLWAAVMLGFFGVSSQQAHAQTQSSTLVYFECDPSNCEESTGYVTQGTATVEANGECEYYGDPQEAFDDTVTSTIGYPEECSSLYQAIASAGYTSATFNQPPGYTGTYQVDYPFLRTEILDFGGTVVTYYNNSFGCDNTGGTTDTIGVAPC